MNGAAAAPASLPCDGDRTDASPDVPPARIPRPRGAGGHHLRPGPAAAPGRGPPLRPRAAVLGPLLPAHHRLRAAQLPLGLLRRALAAVRVPALTYPATVSRINGRSVGGSSPTWQAARTRSRAAAS